MERYADVKGNFLHVLHILHILHILMIMILMTMMWTDQMGRYANVKGKSSTMTLRRSLANLGIDSLNRKVLLRVCDNGADN